MDLLEYNIGNGARAFSTARGEGSGNYGGFNITDYCGDSVSHVAACRRQLCRKLGIEDRRLLLPRQTHGCKVYCIGAGFVDQPQEKQFEALYGVDAVVTAEPRICIGVSTADCIPILLHDARIGVVAAVHAGWRGTVAYIAEKCIGTMQESYGCHSGDIQAIIGPGISLDSFEVGDEVYETFRKNGFDMNRIAARYASAECGEKWHIDLWEANRMQLIANGIDDKNIQVAGVCTYKEYKRFFSARRLGTESGRIFNGIML